MEWIEVVRGGGQCIIYFFDLMGGRYNLQIFQRVCDECNLLRIIENILEDFSYMDVYFFGIVEVSEEGCLVIRWIKLS